MMISTKHKSKILVVADCRERLRFFIRFRNALAPLSCDIEVITNRVSVLVLGLRLGVKVFLVRRIERGVQEVHPNIDQSREFLSGELSGDACKALYCATYAKAINIFSTDSAIKGVFVWNGHSCQDLAVTNAANQFDVKTCFFELSNLGASIFVDPLGVNARSLFYQNLDASSATVQRLPILRDLTSETKSPTLEDWIVGYRRKKKEKIPPKQVKVAKALSHAFLLDWLAFVTGVAPPDKSLNLAVRMQKKLDTRSITDDLSAGHSITLPERFIFMPLQVAGDTQCLLNSDFSAIGAVRKAISISREQGVPLVVRLHPAETDRFFVQKLLTLTDDLLISNLNSYELIEKSECVITVNSTMGFEAIFYNKPVIFIGRSIFQFFNWEISEAYLSDYLIPIDYFSKSDILSSALDSVLRRADINL